MEDRAVWIIYSDESRFNYGAVRGVGAVSLRRDDSSRLSDELARLLSDAGLREMKWEKVRTGRAASAAGKALEWALEHALRGELEVETLTWDATTSEASRARTRALAQLHAVYQTLLASVIARHSERGDDAWNWGVVPDEQTAMPWTRIQTALPQIDTITPERSETQPLIQLADLFTGLAVYSRAAYDAYERWLSFPDHEADALGVAAPRHARGSSAYRLALLDDFYTLCVCRAAGISLRTRRGLYTYRADAPIRFRFQ
jgi:hypothetical protein